MIIPKSRPLQSLEKTAGILQAHGVRDAVALLGVRGYYLDTIGAPGRNERGDYDDAIFLVTPRLYASFNSNTDPSTFRKGIAVLKPGIWRYRVGIHGLSRPKSQQYTALVQAAAVTVVRDGRGDDTGWFGINIHRGGNTTTSSLGCQTIVPAQWPQFIDLVRSSLREAGQKTLPYLLIEEARP